MTRTRPIRILAGAALLAVVVASPATVLAERSAVRPDVAEDSRQIVHVIQKGQNLGMIARRYHTTVEAILQANRLRKGSTLRVGQKLVIPETEEHARWRKRFSEGQGPRGKGQAEKDDEQKPKDKKEREAKRDDEKDDKQRADKKERGDEKEGKKRRAKGERALESYQRTPAKPGHVALVRNDEKFVGQLVDSRGKVIAEASKKVDRLLRSRRSGSAVKMDRRLLKLLAEVSDYFGGRSIIVVSAYRPWSPKQYTKNSRHNHGQAIDFRVVGVPTRVLYDMCRKFKHVGCGYYPNSGFVHMDVREKKTQWTDYSRSGEPPAYAHKRRAAPAKAAKSEERDDVAEADAEKASPARRPAPVREAEPPAPAKAAPAKAAPDAVPASAEPSAPAASGAEAAPAEP
jgi:uncharacterized protein YcbK (DUF882 family)